MARAFGSYPECRRFKYHCRYQPKTRASALYIYKTRAPALHIQQQERKLFTYKNKSSGSSHITTSASALHIYGPVVKRLRHRPFTAVTRVRFSSGSPHSVDVEHPAAQGRKLLSEVIVSCSTEMKKAQAVHSELPAFFYAVDGFVFGTGVSFSILRI